MFQRIVIWLASHLTDLQKFYKDLQDLLAEIAAAVPDSAKATALQNKVRALMQKVEIAGTGADTLHGEVRSRGADLDPNFNEAVSEEMAVTAGAGNGSGFVNVSSLDIEGGTVAYGDKVESLTGGEVGTVRLLRTNEAGAREIVCEMPDTSPKTFAASDVKKVVSAPPMGDKVENSGATG